MRRWLIRIVLLLVIGAVINVAIAWGLAIRPDPMKSREAKTRWTAIMKVDYNPPPIGPIDTFMYQRDVAIAFGEVWILESSSPRTWFSRTALTPEEFIASLPSWSALRSRHPIDDYPDASRFTESATGWPMLSLLGRRWLLEFDFEKRQVRTEEEGILTFPERWVVDLDMASANPFAPQRRNRVPIIPIWPGFYVNTLLYAGAAWLVFFAPFAALRRAKRARRRRKGLCLRCGYDLRGVNHEACSECGATPSEPRP